MVPDESLDDGHALAADGGQAWASTAAAAAAAESLEKHFGRPVKAHIKQLSTNAVFRTYKPPCLVRVARPWVDPGELQENLDRVERLIAAGAPLGRPLSPTVHATKSGHATLWELFSVAPDPHSVVPDPSTRTAGLAAALRELHALDPTGFGLPPWSPLKRVHEGLRRLKKSAHTLMLPHKLMSRLHEKTEKLQASVHLLTEAGPTTVVHCDAHFGNIVWDGERALLVDLDDICVAPPEWDLVSTLDIHRHSHLPEGVYELFCAHYGSDVRHWRHADLACQVRELVIITGTAQLWGSDSWIHRLLFDRMKSFLAGSVYP